MSTRDHAPDYIKEKIYGRRNKHIAYGFHANDEKSFPCEDDAGKDGTARTGNQGIK